MAWSSWLRRVRHDLVKRLLWPARDCRELGVSARPGELTVKLVDDEGNAVTADALWDELRAQAPEPDRPELSDFSSALSAALAAARRDDVAGVLALEASFERLAQVLAREGG